MMFPRCLPTVALFALALLSQGCGKEGTEQGAVSVTEDPRAAALAAERGRALIDQPGSSSDRRILELAIEAFEEAVAMDPSQPDYAYWAGCGYHSLDRDTKPRLRRGREAPWTCHSRHCRGGLRRLGAWRSRHPARGAIRPLDRLRGRRPNPLRGPLHRPVDGE